MPAAFLTAVPFQRRPTQRAGTLQRTRAERGPIPLNRVTACAQNGVRRALGEEDAAGEGGLHPSWRVYEQGSGDCCVICAGTGECKCLFCFGDGVVIIGPEKERDTVACSQCGGRSMEVCVRCAGSGKRPTTRIVLDETEGSTRCWREPNVTNAEVRTRKGSGRGFVDADVDAGVEAAAS